MRKKLVVFLLMALMLCGTISGYAKDFIREGYDDGIPYATTSFSSNYDYGYMMSNINRHDVNRVICWYTASSRKATTVGRASKADGKSVTTLWDANLNYTFSSNSTRAKNESTGIYEYTSSHSISSRPVKAQHYFRDGYVSESYDEYVFRIKQKT